MSTPRKLMTTDTRSAEKDQLAVDEDPTLLLPQRDRARQLWVGAFVLFGVLSILIALFMLTDPATFRGRYVVTTIVRDAGGLRNGDPVQVRGVNVGRVHGFEMTPNGVRIKLELEGEHPIPKDSRVDLKSSGLLGGMTAVIQPGRSSEPLSGGEELPGDSDTASLDVAGVGARADAVLARVQRLLNDRNLTAIDQTLGNVDRGAVQLNGVISSTSAMVAEQRNTLRELTATLTRSAAGLEAATGPELAATTRKLNAVATQMDSAVARLNASTGALSTILARVERGEGTLGKLTRDEQLYDSLVATVASLKSLSDDIRANPRKYINLEIF
jgi:phospholipid/cholesterol/gamma-HCH transport system substrate-binding protein